MITYDYFILQLAIKCNHLEMVKKLLSQCKLNHLDGNSNSIFHYAAPTTKEIINVSDRRNKTYTESISNTHPYCKHLVNNCNLICYAIFFLFFVCNHAVPFTPC